MPVTAAGEIPPEFEHLLDYVRRSRGFDFTGYKRTSLRRRVDKRMQAVGASHYGDYEDYLEVHPDEFAALFDTILINVTSFFRDRPAWDALAATVLPPLLERKQGRGQVRVWSAGCASGEEACSAAMLLVEAMGEEAFRRQVKIYATDVDEDSLNAARLASYDERAVQAIPESFLGRYFEKQGERYVFSSDLRRSIIFGRHDVIQDAPISRIDLLLCRNTLMYFNAETQNRILGRFHFALAPDGVLFLGKAEMLLARSAVFSPVDLKRRLFAKAARSEAGERLLVLPNSDGDDRVAPRTSRELARDVAFDLSPVAQIVIDTDGVLAAASEQARHRFSLGPADIGRPFQDLELSYRPIELRSWIRQAHAERHSIQLKDVEIVLPSGQPGWLQVEVVPLTDRDGVLLGSAVSFADVTRSRQLQEELQHTNRELESAYEELQSTNEELETTNEELQSTVEELETTNEELQSTNEELETMNEELQSTNEQLQTINDELRDRTNELNEVNSYIESIVSSLRGGVCVVDRDMRIRVWSRQVENLWGLRADEVAGGHLFDLDIGLPVDQLRRPIRLLLSADGQSEEIVLRATNRRGREISCRVALTPFLNGGGVGGVVLLMDQVDD